MDPNLAPGGCLQYHVGLTGVIESFNWQNSDAKVCTNIIMLISIFLVKRFLESLYIYSTTWLTNATPSAFVTSMAIARLLTRLQNHHLVTNSKSSRLTYETKLSRIILLNIRIPGDALYSAGQVTSGLYDWALDQRQDCSDAALCRGEAFCSTDYIIIPQGSSGSVGEGTMTFDRFCGKALNDRVAADQPSSSVAITSKLIQYIFTQYWKCFNFWGFFRPFSSVYHPFQIRTFKWWRRSRFQISLSSKYLLESWKILRLICN